MRQALVSAAFLLLTWSAVTGAQDLAATDQLLQRLNQLQHLQGGFTQRQFDESGSVLLESAGEFKLLRPHFFIWEINSPDRQRIVADAEYLWHYDIDLQTITRRPISGAVEASPLQVLSGDESLLREGYVVAQNTDESFTLTPVDEARSFQQLTVTFESGILSRLDIIDRLGQRVEVDLLEVDSELPLSPADFVFAAPDEGVDLFYYDE